MTSLTVGEVCAGYGGLTLALNTLAPVRTAWVADNDPAASKVLAHRFPDAPNLGDITTADWAGAEPVDVIAGGTPCQDVSTAGRQAGMRQGTRSGLWVSMRDAIAAIRPSYVIWENVAGALTAPAASRSDDARAASSSVEPGPGPVGGASDGPVLRAAGRVLGDLASLGYDAAWTTVSASSLGLCHQRKRLFVLAVAQDASHAPRLGLHRGRCPRDRGARPVHGGSGPVIQGRLLPTPTVTDMGAGRSLKEWQEWVEAQQATHRNGNGHGRSLSVEARRLMPTPQVQPDLRQSPGWGVSLADAARAFGDYQDVVDSHAWVVGRPAPSPTEPGARGQARLSARFVEWMMCLPEGWVTTVPGVSRAAQLRLLGNGVVPHQAAHALTTLSSWHHQKEAVRVVAPLLRSRTAEEGHHE